jgi:hypothetical protein
MIYSGKDKMEIKKMNKKGLIWQLGIFILAIIGGYFLLNYFNII